MTHPSKRKGNAAELAVAEYLRRRGYPYAGRMRSGWADDRGDLENVPDTCVEVKAEQRIALAEYMKELETEMANARTGTGVVVVKKRGSAVNDWYAIMPLHLWVDLLKESGR